MSLVPYSFLSGFRLLRGDEVNANFNALSNAIGPMSGVVYYVNETRGSDTNNNGQNPAFPLKTISAALTLESRALASLGLSSVGRNSVVAFWGTIHLTSSITWSLPQTHLVGICAPELRGKRARLSVSGSTGFNKLVSVTAQGCCFQNFGTFFGWTDSSTSLLAWSDTAGRSCYDNVEFLGFGDDTASTGSANLTGSRAFYFSTDNGETTWKNCVFGVDTKTRDATNYTVEIAGGAPRLSFIDCVWEAYLGASGGSSSHLLVGASGTDRYIDIVRGRFHASGSSGGTAMAQALNVNTSAGGTIFLDQCTFGNGVTAIQTTPVTAVQMNMVAATTTGGLSHVVF